MTEFWESAFQENKRMWGEQPTDNAWTVLRLFKRHHLKSILIPGFGYGRNAKVFYDAGMDVTGIELSGTAIERARKQFNSNVKIYHASVTDMPFDNTWYESIYCYSLIHLLNKTDRIQLITNCYSLLKYNGLMVYVALSINDKRFGVGERIEKNTFRSPHGLILYFYDEASIKEEFGSCHIIALKEIDEPEINPDERHWMVVCLKKAPAHKSHKTISLQKPASNDQILQEDPPKIIGQK